MRQIINIFILLTGFLILQSCSVKDLASDSSPINHNLWDSLLNTYVLSNGDVNYKGLVEDSVKLNKYLTLLKSNHPNDKNWSKDEQLAYWINAYNAFTVKLIVDNYPTKSIKDIKNGIPFVNTVWDIKFINIEGAIYDLNNIEHGIIRQKFEEPRIHFAVNCASKSCPPLLNEAYTASKLDEQLTRQTKAFLNDSFRNEITNPTSVKLSKIFSWFRGDFKKKTSLIGFINQYAPIQINKDADIDYLDYDWNLNGE